MVNSPRTQVANAVVAAGLKVVAYSGKHKTMYIDGPQDILIKEIRKNCLLGANRPIKLKKHQA